MKSIFWVLLSLSAILLGACAAPSATPVPASIPTSNLEIPAYYATYSDAANIFSILYPPEWEVNLSLTDDFKFQEYMKKISKYENIETLVETLPSMILFLAGIPTGKGGYSPNVNVAMIPFFGQQPQLDDLVDEKIRGSKKLFAEYTVLLRHRTTVDGTEAIITETESYLGATGRLRHLTMHMLKDEIFWLVTCTSSVKEFSKYEVDFYHIVRSIKILEVIASR